ncbi:hypothetical protein BDN71DRAFT_1482972 [Pleurotus eryngii]|uniref:Uncharacterized protein n=1 Tax=Pleurotus eryngii TaxID=5323 RepID=A0A9P5ZXB4_PLEER|nr:hypothetical protein BDN71DRAFT_1482972 [Pleurotus eryngii]
MVEHNTGLNTAHLPSTQDGYTARLTPLTRQDTPCPLVDSASRVFAVLAGRPSDKSFDTKCKTLYQSMDHELAQLEIKKGEAKHRHGNYPAVAIGVSYGNGQTEPARLATGETGPNLEGLSHLIYSPELQWIAFYVDMAFQLWAPRLYVHYHVHVEKMYEAIPNLHRNFCCSVFPCATLNFGLKVQMFKHRNTMNLGYGWCAITALGRFDHTKGGHLVMWDAKVVIEFPPHSTVLVPSVPALSAILRLPLHSATITHLNLDISDSEQRVSFTQYCAGGSSNG